jgi:hypothetical protein
VSGRGCGRNPPGRRSPWYRVRYRLAAINVAETKQLEFIADEVVATPP